MSESGLRQDGTIAREGALSCVPAGFAAVVDEARFQIAATFVGTRLHSAYIYGSIPRGTAIVGTSDLDLMLALREEPTPADRAQAESTEAELDHRCPQVDGVGILLFSTQVLLSELERHDLGFFVACLCTPLMGHDLADELPRYRPTSLLARETNGDLDLALPQWREKAANATTGADRKVLSRKIARRVVRTGFTLVMPRWGGWTSDLDESADAFGHYYPDRHQQMRTAAAVGRAPSADPDIFTLLLEDIGPWLATEYAAVHGRKAPRSLA